MRVVCLLPPAKDRMRLHALAEACLVFSPQVALGTEAVFVEIGASRQLFTEQHCILHLRELLEALDLTAKIGVANDVASALAFARYSVRSRDALPVEALADYLSPFAATPFAGLEVFRKLGVGSLGDFLKIPRSEIPSRFGKAGLHAYERFLSAATVAWPRFTPEEKLKERVDLDFAAQVESFEPVLFLLKTALQRVFLRLYARRLKLAAFQVSFHLHRGVSFQLNRFSSHGRERLCPIALPLPQSDPKNVLALAAERLRKELELRPLEDSLEGVSLEVLDTAPFHEAQRDFFSRVEEEREAWAGLVGRLTERLGPQAAFLACPRPRLLPEASWGKTLDENEQGVLVAAPPRPLRLLEPPLRLARTGDWLLSRERRWRFTSFTEVERLEGEWWLGGFAREYFRVETAEGEALWVYTAAVSPGGPKGLWLHGFFD